MNSGIKNSLRKLGFSKAELERLMSPLKRSIMRGFNDHSGKTNKMLSKVAGKLRWWLVLIGQEIESTDFDLVPEKRKALLVYKHLNLVWFDEIPQSDEESFSLFVSTQFPGYIRPEDVLEAFNQNEKVLTTECQEIRLQDCIYETRVIDVSINSFPKPYSQPKRLAKIKSKSKLPNHE